jgi:sugar phosphate isomerase/epimerase
LGNRIVKFHLKDFKRQGYQWTNLLDGDVNWPEVRKAIDEIGFERTGPSTRPSWT